MGKNAHLFKFERSGLWGRRCPLGLVLDQEKHRLLFVADNRTQFSMKGGDSFGAHRDKLVIGRALRKPL